MCLSLSLLHICMHIGLSHAVVKINRVLAGVGEQLLSEAERDVELTM